MRKEPITNRLMQRPESATTDGSNESSVWSLRERRKFMKSSLEHRRQEMAKQAAKVAKYYAPDEERETWQGGDIVES